MKLLSLNNRIALSRFYKLYYKTNWKFLTDYPKILKPMKMLKNEPMSLYKQNNNPKKL